MLAVSEVAGMRPEGALSHAGTCSLAGKHVLFGRRRSFLVAAADRTTAGGRNRVRRRPPARTTSPSNTISVPDLAGVEGYSPYHRAPPTDSNVSKSEAGWNRQDSQRREQPGGGRQPGGGGQAGGRGPREAKAEHWGLAVPAQERGQRSGRTTPRPVNGRLSDRQAGRRAPDSWAHDDDDDDDDTLAWGAPSPSQGMSDGQAPHRSLSNSRSERARSGQPVNHLQTRSDLSPAGDRPSSRGSGDFWDRDRGNSWPRGDLGDSRSAAGRTARRVAADDRDSWGGASERAHGSRQNIQEVHRRPSIPRQEKVRLMLQSNADIKAAYEDLTRALEESSAAQDRALVLKEFLEELRAIVESGADHFDPVNVSTAFYQLAAALSDCSGSLSDEIAAEAAELSHRLVTLSLIQVKEFKIGAVFNTVSSLAKLATLDQDRLLASLANEDATLLGDLLEGLAGQALARFRELPSPEPQYLAGLMWAYGKLGVNPLGGRLFAVVLTVSEPLLEGFAPQNLSNLLVAAENLKQPISEAFLERLAQQVVLKMPEASPQGVSNSLWAFAKLTGASPLQGDLFRAGYSRALEDSERFNIQNIANLLWASATVGQPVSRAVLDSLAQAALADMDKAVPQNVSNLLWACARLDVNPLDGSLIEAALAKADQLLPRLSRQELSNSIWALGHLEHSVVSGRMLQRLSGPWAERALVLLSQPNDDVTVTNGRRDTREGWAQHVGNIMWAYSRLRLDPLQGRLATEVGALVEGHISEFTTQNLSNLLLAAATLQRQCFSPAALEAICAAIASDGNCQEVCNTLWSLAAMGTLDAGLLRRMGERLLELDAPVTLSLPEAKQLLLAELAVQLRATSGSEANGDLLPEALTTPARRLVSEAGEEPRISEFHEQVSAALKSMRVPHAIEFASPDGMFSIDIVAKAGDGAPLAIEVDGAHHFTALPPFGPLGSTVLRNRLLSGKGFRGLGVPFYDWERLRGAEERRRYLEDRLAKHGVKPHGQTQAVKAA